MKLTFQKSQRTEQNISQDLVIDRNLLACLSEEKAAVFLMQNKPHLQKVQPESAHKKKRRKTKEEIEALYNLEETYKDSE